MPWACQLHQLGVYLVDALGVGIADVHRHRWLLLWPLQNFEAAPATVAAHAVGRVGDMLQLFEHEARAHRHASDEAGLADVGDAAVDDRAGVHQDAVGLPRGLAPRKPVAQAGVVLARMVVAVLALVVVTLLARRPPRRPPGSRRGGEEPPEVVFAQHGDGDAYIGEQDRGERRQPVAEPKEGDLREEDRGQRCADEADGEADYGGDDVADLSAANPVPPPPLAYQSDPDGESQRHLAAQHSN